MLVIDAEDPVFEGSAKRIGQLTYEDLVSEGSPACAWQLPEDEWDAIALNYTSGTTGNPKGGVYHHRGAAANVISNILEWDMPQHPVYLWTLPMFHCNGWCFPWTLAARAGVNICMRRVDASAIIESIRRHGVTHFCGAPVVHNLVVSAPPGHEAQPAPRRQGDGGRCGATGFDDRRPGASRLRPHACLWPDPGLRPGRGLRQTGGMGIAGRRRMQPPSRTRKPQSGSG